MSTSPCNLWYHDLLNRELIYQTLFWCQSTDRRPKFQNILCIAVGQKKHLVARILAMLTRLVLLTHVVLGGNWCKEVHWTVPNILCQSRWRNKQGMDPWHTLITIVCLCNMFCGCGKRVYIFVCRQFDIKRSDITKYLI